MLEQGSCRQSSLPMGEIYLSGIKVQLELLNANYKEFYFGIYRNPRLMNHINGPLSLAQVEGNFAKCLYHIDKSPPSYISYIIKNDEKLLGLLSLKSVANNEIEFGVIIDTPHQGLGWSSRIKRILYGYLFASYHVDSIVSYCDEDNAVANHINEKLGFELQEHRFKQRFNRVIKKWVCYATTLDK